MIFFPCSIPEAYKPINEYLEKKETFFLKWTIANNKSYLLTLIFFFLVFFKGLFFLFLLLFIVLFQWLEVEKIFKKSQLIYEENSWFESQIWEKEFFLIKNDQFLRSQKIKPIIKRMINTVFFSFFFLCLSYLLIKI